MNHLYLINCLFCMFNFPPVRLTNFTLINAALFRCLDCLIVKVYNMLLKPYFQVQFYL